MLELDDDNEKGEQYHMRYDAVLHYVDERHMPYYRYRLTSDPPTCPTANNESVCVWGNTFWDNSDSDESDMFIWHHERRRKRQRRYRDEDGTSDEESEDEYPEEEEQ